MPFFSNYSKSKFSSCLFFFFRSCTCFRNFESIRTRIWECNFSINLSIDTMMEKCARFLIPRACHHIPPPPKISSKYLIETKNLCTTHKHTHTHIYYSLSVRYKRRKKKYQRHDDWFPLFFHLFLDDKPYFHFVSYKS